MADISAFDLCELAIQFENDKKYDCALEMYEMAMEKGSVNAICNIALMYDFGRGVNQDYKKAITYYELASAKNHRKSQNNLAICYMNGLGTEKNINKAIELYKLSIQQNYLYAYRNLAIHYKNTNNYEEAIPLLKHCVDHNFDDGRQLLLDIYRETNIPEFIYLKYYEKNEYDEVISMYNKESGTHDLQLIYDALQYKNQDLTTIKQKITFARDVIPLFIKWLTIDINNIVLDYLYLIY